MKIIVNVFCSDVLAIFSRTTVLNYLLYNYYLTIYFWLFFHDFITSFTIVNLISDVLHILKRIIMKVTLFIILGCLWCRGNGNFWGLSGRLQEIKFIVSEFCCFPLVEISLPLGAMENHDFKCSRKGNFKLSETPQHSLPTMIQEHYYFPILFHVPIYPLRV